MQRHGVSAAAAAVAGDFVGHLTVIAGAFFPVVPEILATVARSPENGLGPSIPSESTERWGDGNSSCVSVGETNHHRRSAPAEQARFWRTLPTYDFRGIRNQSRIVFDERRRLLPFWQPRAISHLDNDC